MAIAVREWDLRGEEAGVRSTAEWGAHAALEAAYPHLATRYDTALRQARAVALGKLWTTLARERFGGVVPSAEAGRAMLLLPDGTRLSAPLAITDGYPEAAAELARGLAVTRHEPAPRHRAAHPAPHSSTPRGTSRGTSRGASRSTPAGSSGNTIDDPVSLLAAVAAARSGGRTGGWSDAADGADGSGWGQLSTELADSVVNHALALVGEAWRRERLNRADPRPTTALRWAAHRAGADPAFSPLVLFERAVVDGHPLHPCARIRSGMTTTELFAYAPEWADELTAGVVAVARSSFTQTLFARSGMTALLRRAHPDAVAAAEEHLRGARRDPADYELLPVHPWQLRRTLPGRYAGALTDGRVIAIPPMTAPAARIRARPLLSLRTLAPATQRRAVHLKTAVDIRLTTAVRTVSLATAHNGPMMSRLLARISRSEHGFGGRFTTLAELAGGSYRPGPGEAADAGASLAAIVRESPEGQVGDGAVALPVAALTARSPLTGTPLLAEVFDELAGTYGVPLAEVAARFLAGYCDCALPALFALLSRWGVALEAHGQNTIVVLRGGLPVRLLYRDFGGVRVSPIRLAGRGVRPPPLVGTLPTEDEDELRTRLFFPLVHTNLSQLVAALARTAGTDPGRLWRLVARRCRTVYAALTADPAIRAQARRDEAALFGPSIPMKAMLRTQLSADPHAPQWVAVPNPLAVAE